MNVKATLSPEDVARACADAMWRDDEASRGLGMKIVDIKPGQATLTMTVQRHMVNGQRIAHGGFIFALADSAFAFACNSHNERAVAAQGNITFIRPGKLGDVLVATAREISRSGRSGIYDVAGHRWRCRDRRVSRPFPHHRRHLAAEAGNRQQAKIIFEETRDGFDQASIQDRQLSSRYG